MSLLKPIALVTTLAAFSPLPVWAQRVQARLLPVPESEWTEAHREALGARARGDDTLDVFQTCLRNLELCRNWMAFTNYILSERSSITPRDRELLILRTGYLCQSDYEWAQHAALGLRIGLNERGAHAHHARAGCRRLDTGRRHAPPCRRRTPSRPAHQRHHLDAPAGALRRPADDGHHLHGGAYTIVSMYLNSAGVELERARPASPLTPGVRSNTLPHDRSVTSGLQ